MTDASWSLAMVEEWIIHVQGREYGPAGLDTLREWRLEGRLLPENPARRADIDRWTIAANIPGLFETKPPVQAERPKPRPRRSFGGILAETVRIYGKGFFQFLCLTLLVLLPSVCAQLTSAMLEASSNVSVDLRTATAALFTLLMFALSIILWPVYIAGIQLLAGGFLTNRRIGFLSALSEAAKFWPRVAFLCIIVYGVFVLLLLLALGIMLLLAVGASSLLVIIFALALLVLQVWMFGRWFINVLFWQQIAVLEGADAAQSLQRSKQLARSGRHLPWFRRPLWRGAFIASIWVAFVFALEVGSAWASFQHSFQAFMNAQDPQALLEALKTTPQKHGIDLPSATAALLQAMLRPLLGIAFVVLYSDAKPDFADQRSSENEG